MKAIKQSRFRKALEEVENLIKGGNISNLENDRLKEKF